MKYAQKNCENNSAEKIKIKEKSKITACALEYRQKKKSRKL